MTDVDLLLRAGAMLPMTDRSVVYDGSVAVRHGRIIFAGPAGDATDQYSAARTIHNPDAVLTPGLVDTHTHVGAHYFGTLCDEENVITALYDLWFPMEMKYDYETMYAGSCLGLWDALRGGVTTVANDQYFPEATAAAADRLGNRALVAQEINEFSGGHPLRPTTLPRGGSISRSIVAEPRRRSRATSNSSTAGVITHG